MARVKQRPLIAVRSTYRALGDTYVRVTADGCILDADMQRLRSKDNATYRLHNSGQVREKTFRRVLLNDTPMLADTVTGTLYYEATGLTDASPFLRIEL